MSKAKPKPIDPIRLQAATVATDLMTNGCCELATRMVMEGPPPVLRNLGGRNFESVVGVIEKHLRILETLREKSK